MRLSSREKSDPVLLIRAGEYRKAVKLLENWARRGPLDFKMKLKLAEAYEGAGREDDAVALYKKEATSRLAEGNRSAGIVLLKKALKLAPEDLDLLEKIRGLKGGSTQDGMTSAFSFDIEEVPENAAEEPEEESSKAAPDEPVETGPFGPDTSGEPIQNGEEILAEVEVEAPPEEENSEGVDAEEEAGEERDQGQTILAPPGEEGGEESGEALEGEPPGPIEEDLPQPPVEMERVEAEDRGEAETIPEEEQADTGVLEALFPSLGRGDVLVLRGFFVPKELQAGEVLLKEGEVGDSLFIVIEGRFEAKGTFEEGEVNLGVIEPGSVLGEVGFLKGVPRTATVTALEAATVLELSQERAIDLGGNARSLLERLEEILQERVESTMQLLKQVQRKSHGDSDR